MYKSSGTYFVQAYTGFIYSCYLDYNDHLYALFRQQSKANNMMWVKPYLDPIYNA